MKTLVRVYTGSGNVANLDKTTNLLELDDVKVTVLTGGITFIEGTNASGRKVQIYPGHAPVVLEVLP